MEKETAAIFHNELAPMNEFDLEFQRRHSELMQYYNENKEKMSAIEGFSMNLKRKVIETAAPEYMEGYDESVL